MSVPSIPTIKYEAEQVADKAAESRPVELLARLGYVSRGLVHLVIGGLAVRLALGQPGGKSVSSPEAVSVIGRGGSIPLFLVAIGLVGYGVWRFVQAVADTEHKGKKLRGVLQRFGQAINGVMHLGLSLIAFKLAMGWSANTRDQTRRYTAELMAKPFGRWLVAGVGAILVGSAIAQVVESIRAKFAEDFDGADIKPITRAIAVAVGRIGIGMRAIVFGAMGGWLLIAAWRFDPSEAKGLGESLSSLRAQPYGSYLFTAVAFGILAYAFFCFLYAAYRRIAPE